MHNSWDVLYLWNWLFTLQSPLTHSRCPTHILLAKTIHNSKAFVGEIGTVIVGYLLQIDLLPLFNVTYYAKYCKITPECCKTALYLWNVIRWKSVLFHPGLRLLTWINFNHSMGNHLHSLYSLGWKYLSIPNLQGYKRWSLRMDK